MQLSDGSDATATGDAPYSQHPDTHYQPLKAAIPEWLGQASTARRLALKNARPRLADPLKALPATQHRQMKTLNAAHWTAQNDVDQRLAHLQDVSAFAAPILEDALKNRFNIELDVRRTFLRLYVPVTTPWFPVKTGARVWSVSLLDAALHNFEEKETEDDAFEGESTFSTEPTPTGQFETLPAIKARLSVAAFTQLCRELDIGTRYQRYLEENLGLNHRVASAVLQLKINASQQSALTAALHFAQMTGDISQGHFTLITGLLDGLQGMRVNGAALLCQELTLLSASLTGVLVFAPDPESTQAIVEPVLYLPDDPHHPVKQYASMVELEKALTQRLRYKDYQRFFSRFIDYGRRGEFFATLNSRLSKITWHPPVPGSSEPTWRETPLDKPKLQLAIAPIRGNLWGHLYQIKLNKILNDARVIAVPTATVDQKARWAYWDSLIKIATSIVETAALIIAPFVPVLGEAMMAYMAYQLLDETFEGIVEWAQGRTTEAFEHLMGTVESLVQLGTFAIGGSIGAAEFRKVLPDEIVAFIDRFKPVARPDGHTRYWDQDLTPYEQASRPGGQSLPNELGLHQHEGKTLLPLEDAHYAVSESAVSGHYQIEHPTRPDAYTPTVRHNGDGAWHTELEQPLEWDEATALRRIGHAVESFSPAQRERILQISGSNENALRKMHIDQQPVPPLLADTLKRFKIDQDLKLFVEQLGSELPERYLSADPSLQLQLLSEHGKWPADKPLRLIDRDGALKWQSVNQEHLSPVELRQDSLMDGDLLKTLLSTLDEHAFKALLGREFAGPTPSLDAGAKTLRKQLAQLAWEQRTALFESRYQALERIEDPLAPIISQYDSQLPTSITRELLHTATGEELLEISQGQLPDRQQQLVQVANQELRVTRAYEGLELESVNNPDSETLALHSLKQLPGWTGEVRIEIRDRHYEGVLLDSTGRADAPAQKVLVRQSDGRYQPYDDRGQELQAASDFYSSVLYALPDSERQALDIHIGQSEALKKAIRGRPVPRDELRLAITPPPLIEEAADTLRLLGSDGYPPLLRHADRTRSRTATLEDRARALYPRLNRQELRRLISALQERPLGAHAELSRLGLEYSQLRIDLARWANDLPLLDPATGATLTPIQRRAILRNRELFRTAVERSWRRETRVHLGDVLYLTEPISGELPVLNADFSHVSGLTIAGNASTRGLEAFRQHFPNLVLLELRHFTLAELPPSLTAMPRLRQLIVRNCGITLSAADQQLLSSLTELTLLDLQGNPLAATPDISAMQSLSHLNLAATGIYTVPAGVLNHPQTIFARFDGNLISELPAEFFALTGELSEGFDFSNNPLSAAAREQIKAHYMRTAQHFGVLAEPMDIARIIILFPELDPYQATDLLYRLPGTLEQGRGQLAHWEAELIQLNNDLARWAESGPDRDPVSGSQLSGIQQQQERLARENFRRTLQQAWRNRNDRQLTLTAEFTADMPAIAADFSHITSVTIRANASLTAPDPFLQCFTGLHRLEMIEFALADIPQAIAGMPGLRTLMLDQCDLVMTAQGQALLNSLSHLHTLEMIDNPLGVPPDITALTRLTHLDLSRTGISTLPAGLINHPSLDSAYLTGNRFTDLPDALFALTPHRSDGIDLADNPLSAATRERIKTYFHNVRQDFGVSAPAADIEQVRTMFPALDRQDASDVIYDLPGTLADGRARLQQWSAEFKQLKLDLAIWEHNAGVDADKGPRATFSKTLEKFWRRRPEIARLRDDHFVADLTFAADMPRLSTDFSHVTRLTLNGNVAIGGVEAFLDLFPNLHTLNLRNFHLQQIPEAVTRMPSLKQMTLSQCGVTLSPAGQAMLSSLGDLELLDLGNNPLGNAPDLTAMPNLVDLWLPNTGITSLPNGLTTHPRLKIAILSNNQITDLPQGLFPLARKIAVGIDLANNPMSASSRDLIKSYFAAFTDDFGVLAEQADIDRARALFVELSPAQASRLIYKLPGTLANGRSQLGRWELEIAQLVQDLGGWVEDLPAQSSSDAPLSDIERLAERDARDQFRQQLEQFWRQRLVETAETRADAFGSNLAFTGQMPALSADFSHVTTLALNGNQSLSVSADFLQCFTGVKHLALRGFGLGRVPQAITGMQSLENLILSQCAIVFDAAGQSALSSLPKLSRLDLFFNPLAQLPDLAGLPGLAYIDFSSTGVDQVPAGLANHPTLKIALLTDNRITEIPHELYPVPSDKDLFFGGNPLSAATLEQIKAYYQDTGKDMGVLADQADRDLVQSLYPELDATAASNFIYQIPGTLADGRLELLRREAELSTLISDLSVWMTDIPDHPATGLALDAESLLEEQRKRREFKESLESCWRRIPAETVEGDPYAFYSSSAILGELPTLTADFSHVPELYLTSTVEAGTRIGNFLDYFPNVQSLAVRGYHLGDIPAAIFRMGQLTSLSLPASRITLTQATLSALAGMERLDYLNLRDNPLGLVPDLSNMSGMSILNLSHTGITHIPNGLLSIDTWLNVDLSHNAMTVMPADLLEVDPEVSESFDFSDNPFNAESLRIIANYYRETENDLGIDEIVDMPDDEENRPPVVEIED